MRVLCKMEFDIRMMIILLMYKFSGSYAAEESTEAYDSREGKIERFAIISLVSGLFYLIC